MLNKIQFVTFILFLSVPTGLFAADKAETAASAAAPTASTAKEDGAGSAAGNAATPAKDREPAMAKSSPPLALTQEGLRELEARERAVSEKEKEIAEREESVQVQERVLQNKLKRIEEVSKQMAGRLDKFKADAEGKVAKVVAMLESMKPDAAAAYVENVDPFLAVEIMARINTQKAAKIWNKMDKKISARLSELYTGFRTRIEKEVPAPPVGTPKSIPAQDKG